MNEVLHSMIQTQKNVSFHDPSEASDEEALGILIANHFEWDGNAILATAAAALEDANFHNEAAAVEDMRSKMGDDHFTEVSDRAAQERYES